ncbi:acyl transferase/acyl hydrolase/lysophospholipase [Rhodocollybia butyracea]|uniref:Acyl transferase/acyl hydrolase/lysophospholipase n=1 Tax=Rhodocollybia butyracea TaxID=206335 RepID=A0A9P5PA18_9AGAR|nr:acyl transferase/acyl hydrolase/lysophospholipase [Rhodocollybia butyracea]
MGSMEAGRKYVLSIDGGGFRGLACLVMLNHLMEILNRDQDTTLLPCDVFDLICGTSTGGLIAILLGRLGLDCITAISIYKELGSDLFGNSANEKIVGKTANAHPNFFDEKLAIIIERYSGAKDAPLKLPKANNDKIHHKSTDIFVTTVHSASTAGVDPHRLRSYMPHRHAVQSIPGHNWTVCEAAHAALASPAYLQPFCIESYSFQDASNSGAANPILESLSEVELRWGSQVEPVIISLGTGLVSFASINPYLKYEPPRPTGGSPSLGKLKRMFKNNNKEKTQASAEALAKQLHRVAQDTELLHQAACMRFQERDLSGNYFRLNPTAGLGDMNAFDAGKPAGSRIMSLTYSWLGSREGLDMTKRALGALRAKTDGQVRDFDY